ncbi:uncharacterized protein LOC120351999 [Nilaparvata lugens]|uniref:uncharacterized protein LOC120351999 n=1 Tax=Nilaparvata lugens TaxID=108931 RepID=UPI00193E0777|nr:uncharacterized protein LOC120351999 [Nilaparvata lugens]
MLKLSNILECQKNGKDTSWWNPEIDTILKGKKRLFKQWQCSKTPEDRERCKLEYAIAKKAAKRVVAQVKALSNENFYAKIETTKEAQKIFKIAKQRHYNCQDINMVKFIKNEEGQLLTDDEVIEKRWKEYYSQLLNETFPSEELQPAQPTIGPIPSVTLEEVGLALQEMSNNKATEPDGIPVEVWKKLDRMGLL